MMAIFEGKNSKNMNLEIIDHCIALTSIITNRKEEEEEEEVLYVLELLICIILYYQNILNRTKSDINGKDAF